MARGECAALARTLGGVLPAGRQASIELLTLDVGGGDGQGRIWLVATASATFDESYHAAILYSVVAEIRLDVAIPFVRLAAPF